MNNTLRITTAVALIAGFASPTLAGYWSYKWNAPDANNCTLKVDPYGEEAWWCETSNKKPIDMIIHGGKIYTANQSIADPSKRFVEAIGIKGNKIVFAGKKSTLDKQYNINTVSAANNINLKGGSAVPGFHDIHMHPMEAGSELLNCNLNRDANISQIKSAIKKCLKQSKTRGYVLGHGHTILNLVKASPSPIAILDSVSKTVPIIIMEETSHSAWVNSAALKDLGINKNTADPAGGHIVKDDNGNPNGILLDTAGDNAFHDVLNNPTSAMANKNYEGLKWSLKQISKRGITSFVNARIYWERKNQDVWKKAANNNLIKARAHMALWIYPEDKAGGASPQQIQTQVNAINDIRTNYHNPSKNLHFDHIKFYSDGITINTTADFLAPYKSAKVKAMGLGMPASNRHYIPKDDMTQYIAKLEAKGFTSMIHAIGDKGVRSSLDAIKAARDINNHAYDDDQRHRLTHIEYVSDKDLPRFADENVIADFQVSGVWTLPGNHDPDELALLGKSRMDKQLPIGKVFNQDGTVVLSSDWDVSDPLPLLGIEHVLQRGTAGSLPNIYEAVDAYTANAAIALGHDNKVGQIKVGMLADISIISKDIFALAKAGDLDKIGENTANDGGARINKTIFNGKVVYSR